MMKQAKAAGDSKKDRAAREAEQKRMEASQLEETQALLRAETLRRIRRFGQLAGASTSLPGFIGNFGGAGAASGGLSGGGGLGGGGGVGGFSGLQIGQF